MVGAELFSVLRASAALGRTFTDADARPNAPLTVVLSDGLWRSRFGADPGIVGRPVSLDGTPYQVIGVMPAGFEFPDRRARLWTPLVFTEALYEDRNNNTLQVVAQLTPGTSIEQARADLAIVARRLEQLYPVANKETGATLNRLREEGGGSGALLPANHLSSESAARCDGSRVRDLPSDGVRRDDLAGRDQRRSGDPGGQQHRQPPLRDARLLLGPRHSAAPRARPERPGPPGRRLRRRGLPILRHPVLA